jgi:hypothetical protein
VLRLLDGRTAPWLPPALALLELLLELLELDDVTHGGTINVVTLLFAGTTSWFWGAPPVLGGADAPPVVPPSRFAITQGGGALTAVRARGRRRLRTAPVPREERVGVPRSPRVGVGSADERVLCARAPRGGRGRGRK